MRPGIRWCIVGGFTHLTVGPASRPGRGACTSVTQGCVTCVTIMYHPQWAYLRRLVLSPMESGLLPG